jgi:hypothetical protein
MNLVKRKEGVIVLIDEIHTLILLAILYRRISGKAG